MAFVMPMREGSGVLNGVFKKVSLKDAPKLAGELVSVMETNTVEEVCALLQKHHILAVPYERHDVPEGQAYEYAGMIDVITLAGLLYQGIYHECKDKDVIAIGQTEVAKMKLLEIPADTITPFASLSEDASLYDAILLVAKRNYKRIAIYSKETGKIINILTQTAVVKMILDVFNSATDQDYTNIESVFNKPLAEVGWGKPRQVLTVREGQTFGRANEIMALNHVSSLAVVDENSIMVGCVSVREACNMLLKDAHVNLADTIKAGPVGHFVCHNTLTVGQAFEQIQSNFAHAVYIVDDQRKPIGVATLRDLMMLLVKEEKPSKQ